MKGDEKNPPPSSTGEGREPRDEISRGVFMVTLRPSCFHCSVTRTIRQFSHSEITRGAIMAIEA